MTNKKEHLKIFDDQQIRSHWDADAEMWFFSIIDVIGVLTESDNPRKYWSVLKTRLKAEGNETATNCSQLKLTSPDGKQRLTDVATTEQLLRLIQSIPSPKAEPFKLWLATVGYERLEEQADPEKTIDRALKAYLAKGYSKDWINQRLKTIELRKELTDEWESRGVKTGSDFAMLTNILTKEWSGLSVKEYKQVKGLKRENLRDNMTNTELVLNMLAETATKEISQKHQPNTMQENISITKQGGEIAKIARENLEKATGSSVLSQKNAQHLIAEQKARQQRKKIAKDVVVDSGNTAIDLD
jgi:hypothetical protein